MTEKFKGSIKLDWINRDKSLCYEYDSDGYPNKEPKWVEKEDISVSEPRILKLMKEYGDVSSLIDPLSDSLIRGDNLLALRTLVEMFKEKEEKDKVKCIYIDPPFNTGNEEPKLPYPDNLLHSEWLTMIRDRIVLLKKLLRKDGIIIVHIDETELAYLRVILDEVFNRENAISLITWERGQRTALGQGHVVINDSCEYILIYAKNKSMVSLTKLQKEYDIEEKTYRQYNKLLKFKSKPKLIETFVDNFGKGVNIYEMEDFEEGSISLTDFEENFEEIHKNYLNNYDHIIRFSNQQEESSFQQKLISKFKKDKIYQVEYTPSRGRNKGKVINIFYYGPEIILYLKNYTKREGSRIIKLDSINNFWDKKEFPMTGIAKEGHVEFKRGKKPEKLIKRLLTLGTTERNQVVLDSFLGSGTTAAVAHKMGLRWIGIEMGKQAETHCLERMKGVVDKKNIDKTGISKNEDIYWQGGGGFRYYKLSDSLIKDQDLNWELNHEGEDIAKSIFMTFDFRFKEKMKDGIFIGKSGKKIALGILSKELKIIQKNELKGLIKEVSKKYPYDHLTIYTNCGIAIKDEDIEDNLDIKKVPEIILKKYKM